MDVDRNRLHRIGDRWRWTIIDLDGTPRGVLKMKSGLPFQCNCLGHAQSVACRPVADDDA